MASGCILQKVYNNVTGEILNPENFESKLIMQKTVYLLSEIGINIDDYSFSWDTYGPFSQQLQNDLNDIDIIDDFENVLLSTEAEEGIKFLNRIYTSNNSGYTSREWLESIASCLYLKKYKHPRYTWDEILSILTSIKEYLDDSQANKKAADICVDILNYDYKHS